MLGEIANILAATERVLAVIGAMALIAAAVLFVAARFTNIDTRW